jgi:hypothetical protein
VLLCISEESFAVIEWMYCFMLNVKNFSSVSTFFNSPYEVLQICLKTWKLFNFCDNNLNAHFLK